MIENRAHRRAVGRLIRRVQGTSSVRCDRKTTDRRILGHAAVDTLPDELLLEIFDFSMWRSGDWETLVQVCQRWRSIVLSAPHRLRLRLVCTGRTPVRERLYIWPKLPIVLRVLGGFYGTNDNIIAALEHRDRIYEIYFDCVSNDELERLAGAMEVSFPTLTSLYLNSIGTTAPFFSESFLGGSGPNLQSLCLKNAAFPALVDLLLSVKHLVNLSLSDITRSTYEAMVDCLSSLTWLETLLVEFRSSHYRPYRASRRPAPTTRTVLSKLTSLTFQGVMGYLDHLFTHMDAPLLEDFDILFFNPVGFNDLQLSPFIVRTKTFEGFNQAHMNFRDDFLDVILSRTTGGMSLTLSTAWTDSAWELWSLTQDCPFSPPRTYLFDYRYLPPWTKDMGFTPWLEVLRILNTVENLYLSDGVMLCIAPALLELTGEGVAEVLPALQNIFINRLPTCAAGIIQEVMERFVVARELSGHPVVVNID